MADPTPPPDTSTPSGAAPAPAPKLVQTEPGKVAVINPSGELKQIPAANLDAATKAGYKPATEAEYWSEKQGIAGKLLTAQDALLRGAMLGGSDAATIALARAAGGEGQAETVRQSMDLAREANPGTAFAGELAGSLAPLAMGAPPALSSESVPARIGLTAAREAAVGGAIGAGQQLTEDTLGNHDLVAQKYLASTLHGALLGGVLGGGLAGGGALLSRLSKPAARAAEAVGERAGRELAPIDADAGLRGLREWGAQEAPPAFRIAEAEQPIGLRPMGGARMAASEETPLSISRELAIDPDAGIFAPRSSESAPIFAGKGGQMRLAPEAFRAGAKGERALPGKAIRAQFEIGINPNAGLEAEEPAARDVFRFGKAPPQAVKFGAGGFGDLMPIETAERAPIGLPTMPAAAPAAAPMNAIERAAAEQAFKGLLPTPTLSANEWQRLGRTAEEQHAAAQRLGKLALDEGISTPLASTTAQAERITEKVRDAGEALGRLRGGLDQAVARPSMTAIADAFEREIAAPLRALPLGEQELGPAEKFLADMVQKGGDTPSFAKLFSYRRRLDALLERGGEYARIPTAPAKAGADALRQLRGVIEGEYERAAEQAAAEKGETFADKYRVAKARYADLKTLEKITTKASARSAQHRAISLTDTIAGAAGYAAHGPIGLGAALVNKGVRTYDNQIAASALSRIAKLETVANMAQAFDRRKAQAVRAFYGHGKPPPRRALPSVTPEQTRAIRDAVGNPAELAAHVSDAIGATDLHQDAPKLTAAMTNVAMRAAGYLQQTLPPEPPPVGVQFGPAKPRKFGLQEQTAIDNVVHALNADAVLDDIARGRIDRQKLEALRIINPELAGDITNALREYGREHGAPVDVQREVALSIIFGQPLTPLMEPATIRGFQGTFNRASQQVQQPPKRPMNPAAPSSLATGMDRIEKGAA